MRTTLFPDSPAAIAFWLRALLLIGEDYQEHRRKTKAAVALQSYWKHVEKRRAESREERQRNRDKWIAYSRAYRAANPEKHAAYVRKWREKNRESVLATHLRQYGITLDEYNRMLIDQGGCCAICGAREGRSKAGGVRLHVDHDHATGKARGLLCGTCNRGIGQLGDDPARVRAAVRYLERGRRRQSEARQFVEHMAGELRRRELAARTGSRTIQ